MAKRLIDAEALGYTRVRIFHGMNEDGTPCVGGLNAVVMSTAIRQAPTVDAVEVVYCGKCKYQEDCMQRIEFMGRDLVLELNTHEYYPLRFCSYGERKEGWQSIMLAAERLRFTQEH